MIAPLVEYTVVCKYGAEKSLIYFKALPDPSHNPFNRPYVLISVKLLQNVNNTGVHNIPSPHLELRSHRLPLKGEARKAREDY